MTDAGTSTVVRIPAAPGVELAVRHRPPTPRAGDPLPARRAVVLVHGLASNARLWDGVADALAARGHRVDAVDLRGHGRSDKPDDGYDVTTVADDLVAVVDRLGAGPDDRPILAGQSWGGNVVVEFAARHPGAVAGVVAVDGGVIDLQASFPRWEDCAAALAPPHLIGTPARDLEAHFRRTHPDWPESGIVGTMANFCHREDGTVAPWLTRDRHLSVLRGLWEHRTSSLWPRISEPVRFLMAGPDVEAGATADRDGDRGWQGRRRVAVAEACAELTDGGAVWIDGDHDLHAQYPELVADHIAALDPTVDPAAGDGTAPGSRRP